MAERKNTHGLRLTKVRGITIVDIGNMEIWDGADLSLVRDTLQVLISRRRRRAIGVNMRHVKHVPGGYFGMLYDWFELGVKVFIVRPQERVQNMLWFRRFFVQVRPGLWRLKDLYPTGIDADMPEDEVQTAQPSWSDAAPVDAAPQLLAGAAR